VVQHQFIKKKTGFKRRKRLATADTNEKVAKLIGNQNIESGHDI
jgi:hypothetical protein